MAVSTLGLYAAPVMEGNGSFAGKTPAIGVTRSALSIAMHIGLCLILWLVTP